MDIAMLEGQSLVLQIILTLKLEDGSYINKMLRESYKDTSRMTVYRAIRRLRTTGLIANQLKDNGRRGGITREYYLTPAGQDVADHLLAIEKTLRSSKKEVRRHRRAGID